MFSRRFSSVFPGALRSTVFSAGLPSLVAHSRPTCYLPIQAVPKPDFLSREATVIRVGSMSGGSYDSKTNFCSRVRQA